VIVPYGIVAAGQQKTAPESGGFKRGKEKRMKRGGIKYIFSFENVPARSLLL